MFTEWNELAEFALSEGWKGASVDEKDWLMFWQEVANIINPSTVFYNNNIPNLTPEALENAREYLREKAKFEAWRYSGLEMMGWRWRYGFSQEEDWIVPTIY